MLKPGRKAGLYLSTYVSTHRFPTQSAPQDIEELAKLGGKRGACAYYATRGSVPLAEVERNGGNSAGAAPPGRASRNADVAIALLCRL